MKQKETSGDENKADSIIQWIFQNAQGVMIELDSAPTSAIPLLKEKECGYYSNKVYFVLGGTLKEFAVSSTP